MTLITVIITTYNRPIYLQRAIKSVVNQTYNNLEILVIDGSESKINKDVVSKFKDKRLIYIPCKDKYKMPRYGSVQYARNTGIRLSHGKYIAMLDDDDMWDNNKINKQLFYAENYNASLVSCYMKTFNGDSFTIDKPMFNPKYKDLLRSFNMSCTSSYFLNKCQLLKIGGFNEELRSMHEYQIALELAKKGYNIIVVPEPLMIRWCDNAKERSFYYTKISEVFDMYRFYGKDFITYLGVKGFAFNVMKSSLLITLFLLGYIFKEKIWDIIFPLKQIYQEKYK